MTRAKALYGAVSEFTATWRHLLASHTLYDQRGDLHFTAPAPAADPAGPMTDEDVLAALAGIWADSGWRRLEISQQDDQSRYGGYCMTSTDIEVRTVDLVARNGIIGRRLAALLDVSGWQRLEAIGYPPGRECGGWCERADGSGLNWAHRPGDSPVAGDGGAR